MLLLTRFQFRRSIKCASQIEAENYNHFTRRNHVMASKINHCTQMVQVDGHSKLCKNHPRWSTLNIVYIFRSWYCVTSLSFSRLIARRWHSIIALYMSADTEQQKNEFLLRLNKNSNWHRYFWSTKIIVCLCFHILTAKTDGGQF